MDQQAVAELKERIAKDRPKLGEVVKLAKPKPAKQWAPKRLDIACGTRKTDGYKGIDLGGDADIIHDLFSFPWPIKANSVEEASCSHFIEHIPDHTHTDDGGTVKNLFWRFFDELYRISKPDAVIRLLHPYVKNDRAWWDPSHVRFVHEMNYYYLDAQWRQQQQLDHYPVSCDFVVVTINAGLPDDVAAKNDQWQAFARNHYWNAVGDIEVTLRCRK